MRMAIGMRPNFLHRLAWFVAQCLALRNCSKKGDVEEAIDFVLRNEIALHSHWPGLRKSAIAFHIRFEQLGGLGPILKNQGEHWGRHPVVVCLENKA